VLAIVAVVDEPTVCEAACDSVPAQDEWNHLNGLTYDEGRRPSACRIARYRAISPHESGSWSNRGGRAAILGAGRAAAGGGPIS
jgi:hypothetical protein